jgi:methylated-DNA-[protein]-cysteine S-methyltransferase
MHSGSIDTAFGLMWARVDDDGCVLELLTRPSVRPAGSIGSRRARLSFKDLSAQLREYLSRSRTAFDIPIRLDGSRFALQVWNRLQKIPYGTTMSYGELAAELGVKGAARAVGRANGANPIPIIVPCHRVIGSDGSLVGYGSGVALKRALLDLEGFSLTEQLPLIAG